jgi:CheY-like chemotaxis protein
MFTSRVIFVADDDPDDIAFIREPLRQQERQTIVMEYNNGRALIKALEEMLILPVFILLDINMPIMGGMETLAIIRRNKDLADLPVIILSTSGSTEEKTMCLAAGATDYIRKPYNDEGYQKIAAELASRWLV